MNEFSKYDAVGLGQMVLKKKVSPLELVKAAIEGIEKINPQLNAVIYKLYEQARKEAQQLSRKIDKGEATGTPFPGVPFLLKDLIAEYRGAPIHEGSRAVKGYVSKVDSEIVKRQKAAGLVILGKTNTPEFGLLPATEPLLYGPTKNPWNLKLNTGGSSGGSAAAVASGLVPMAHGNDGGGSIRVPASCCGLFGLKPTRGRNTLAPLFGDVTGGLAHEHGLTRTVRDSAALLDATSGPAPGDPYWAPPKERPYLKEVGRKTGTLKIGVLMEIPPGWHDESQYHPDCREAVKSAAHLCEELGHKVEKVKPAILGWPGLIATFGAAFACVAGHGVSYWERELGKKIQQDELEPFTWLSYQAGLKRTGPGYLDILEEIQSFSRKIALWYEDGGYDLLLTPTMAIPPTELGAFLYSKREDLPSLLKVTSGFVALTKVQNMTGQPAMSVPLYWNKENIPIGVQFAGKFGEEGTLFRLAAQLEKARPWANKRPPIWAG
jgi:amidase